MGGTQGASWETGKIPIAGSLQPRLTMSHPRRLNLFYQRFPSWDAATKLARPPKSATQGIRLVSVFLGFLKIYLKNELRILSTSTVTWAGGTLNEQGLGHYQFRPPNVENLSLITSPMLCFPLNHAQWETTTDARDEGSDEATDPNYGQICQKQSSVCEFSRQLRWRVGPTRGDTRGTAHRTHAR